MNHPPFHLRPTSHQAFTLVELLVAMAVLVTLTVFLTQAVSLTSQAITMNSKKLDAAGQARAFFDRLAIDLAARPRRPDLGMQFTKIAASGSIPGNDTIQFYSAVDGYASAARQITWISYQIPTTSTTSYLPAYQLERGANSSTWSGATPVYWVGGAPASFLVQTPAANAGNYTVMANGVFRLEFSFLLNTGLFTNSNTTAPTYSNVTALVVAVAVLDNQSLALLNASQIKTLSAAFPDTTEGHDPLTDWTSAMAVAGFGSGIPPPAVQNVRLYQRTFYVP